MKTLKMNNGLKLSLLVAVTVLNLFLPVTHAKNNVVESDVAIKSEVKQFFDTYLKTYNQRFGRPDRTESFINSLSNLVHQPFIMSPPTGAPFQPKDQAAFTQVFNGFVQQLEKKGAVKLTWKSVDFEILSPNKVLANNIGIATNVKGDVIYETISVYLLYRSEDGWKIVLFSPYELERSVVLN